MQEFSKLNGYHVKDAPARELIANLTADINNRFFNEDNRISELEPKQSMTKLIPTDYPDLETAIHSLANYDLQMNEEIVLKIESGHALTKGLMIENGDYSRFRIQAEDDVVSLDSNFVGYNATRPGIDGIDNTLFVGINCTFPTIECLFDMNNLYGDGVALYNSRIHVGIGAGVINAGRFGIYAKNSSNVSANGTIWSGSNSCGIRLQHTTCGTFMTSTLDGCCKTDNTLASVYISKGCIAQVRESTISNNTKCFGVLVRRSRIDLESTVIDSCLGGIKAEGGSVVSGQLTQYKNISGYVAVWSVSSIIVGGTCSNNAKGDFSVQYGGMILDCAKSSNSETGVLLSDCRGVSSFNLFEPNGMINTHYETDSFYKVETTQYGYSIKMGNTLTVIERNSPAVTLAPDGYVNIETGFTIPSGWTIKDVKMTCVGRTNAVGGGDKIAVDAYYETPTYVLLHNTGKNLNGTVANMQSVNIYCVSQYIKA